MSASSIARQATLSQNIPSKRIVIDDPNQLPANYSSTPGGTLYSTTPGGTRIIYDRAFLLKLRNSPISQTPPKNMSAFTAEILKGNNSSVVSTPLSSLPAKTPVIEEVSELFEMDM